MWRGSWREEGFHLRTNTFVRDMDLEEVHVLDGRRLEVVADGLTLWHGAQLAETFEGDYSPGALRGRRKGTLGGACC